MSKLLFLVIKFAIVSIFAQVELAQSFEDKGIPVCDCHNNCMGPQLVYVCGTETRDIWQNPCFKESYASLPYCNESLSYDDRVKDLLSRVPIKEKLGSSGAATPLTNWATEMPSVGIKYSQWWNEALHGVAISPGILFEKDVSPYATSFPQIIATSHSFNRTLFAAIGAAIAIEVRAFANMGHSGLTLWTPNLNIFRDPRWYALLRRVCIVDTSRGQETPGEDPYLTSAYVESYVPALQYDGTDSKHLKVSACCKHYVAYSVEKYQGMDRHHFNSNVTAQDMTDTYLPAFEACASPDKAGASCIMCSYNEINGVPSCANKQLLEKTRKEWKFDGYITSDCGAVEDVYDTHHYAKNPEQAVKAVLDAGMDMECGKFFVNHLKHTYDTGKIDAAMIDTALGNLLKIHMRLGRFDQNSSYNAIGMDQVNTPAHQRLAEDAARQSVVLLKNTGNTLPLSVAEIKTLAVIGPNADAEKTMLGNYEGIPPFMITPLDGFKAVLGEDRVTYALGCDIDSDRQDGFTAAVTVSSSADAIVLVMGIDQSQEKEGKDRNSIALPGQQINLIEAVLSAVNGTKPVILVIEGGGAVCLGLYKDDPRVGAILFIGYPGQAGGVGVSEAVFGMFSPSGRLTQTFYRGDFIDEVSFLDMNMRKSDNNPGRGYRFYEGDAVVYPFGHGLSYTVFNYTWVSESVTVDPLSVTLSVQVTNSGNQYTASETVLVFLSPPSTTDIIGAPKKYLRYFDKVSLAPGESTTLTIPLTAQDFQLSDETGAFRLIRGDWTVKVGMDVLTKTFTV